MKIFWFTNTLMPELASKMGLKSEVIGGWMSSLLDALRSMPDVELAVASIDPGASCLVRHDINGVVYFLLPLKRSKSPKLTPVFVDACDQAVKAFHPNIIHVHGTEDVYGLYTARSLSVCPVVISIQGLLHVYSRHVGGGIAFEDALDGQRDGLLSWLRYHYQKIQWTERGRVEKLLINGNGNFIGRTDWDKAHVLAVNPDAKYFYGGELLRPPFYTAKWDIAQAQRHIIFCTAAHSPLKGFHWLLYAVILLRREFSDIKVRVAGAPWNEKTGFGYYGRYIKRLIDKYDLSHQIIPLPSLSAEEVAKELCKAHAFVIPSLIENSPNSLAEAMLVGTPCVAAYVGGIPTMSVHNVSSLLFPSGDAACLAYYVRRIFTDDFLAQQLSGNAKKVASDRHNAEKINARQLEIYRQITSGAHGRLQ